MAAPHRTDPGATRGPGVLGELGARWAASGAMALTGRADGPPLGAPAGLVEGVLRLGRRFAEHAATRGRPVELDALALLGERATFAHLHRRGDVSCGGATRLLPTSDGTWIALCLARDGDADLVDAWLQDDAGASTDVWERVAASVATRTADVLVERAALVGLACARVGESTPPEGDAVIARRRIDDGSALVGTRPLVVDLSSLWAGPLCAQLLGVAGARVVKVESTRRPDGARHGPVRWFDLLHAGHEHVALDLAGDDGRRTLRRLLQRTDVVITASRPRALHQMGCEPDSIVGPRVWLQITAHTSTDDGSPGRIGFGDDLAAAGGLVVIDEQGPCFVADAVADPLSGLAGAVAVLDHLATGGSWHLDLAMSRLAAGMSTGPIVGTGLDAAPPRARAATGRAPALGAHTAAVTHELVGR